MRNFEQFLDIYDMELDTTKPLNYAWNMYDVAAMRLLFEAGSSLPAASSFALEVLLFGAQSKNSRVAQNEQFYAGFYNQSSRCPCGSTWILQGYDSIVGHARRRSRRHQPASRSRLRLESFHVLRRCLMPNPIAYTAGSCALSSVLSPLYRNSGAWRRTCSPRKGRWPDPMS